MTVMDMAQQERSELHGFLATLTEEQWRHPSLCQGWNVRDVVAHVLSYDDLTWRRTLTRFLAGRLDTARINATTLADYQHHTPDDLLQRLATHLRPAGLTAGMGGPIGLTDALIHHQDIRRPLGLGRQVPLERVRAALPVALFAPVVQGIRRVYDVRLVATDTDWSFGRGPQLRGPAEALLLVVAGRRAALKELDGPASTRVAARLPG